MRDAVPDVIAERSVDADGISAYGASTIRDILNEIAREKSDDEDPVVYVNGVPDEDFEDIADYPAEAVERIDVLPRGAGARAGGKAGQSAYNVVLRKSFGAVIGAAVYGLTSEGGWSSRNGELVFTRITGQKRFNANLCVVDDSLPLESERGIIQPAPQFPFANPANIVPDPLRGATEIDPALSAALGRPVPLVGIAPGLTVPTFADMVAGAFQPNETEPGAFRSLRPASRTYEAGMNYSQPLNSWLNLTANARFEQTHSDGRAGLPAGLFILPQGHPQSPFAEAVGVARYDENTVLRQDVLQRIGTVSLGLNAHRGKWQFGLRGNYRRYEYTSKTDRQTSFVGEPIVLTSQDNPFLSAISRLLPIALEPATPPGAPPAGQRPGPKPVRMLFGLSHIINLLNEVTVRDGVPVIDRLDGGATGFGGSLPRHRLVGSVNVSNELGGIRIAGSWRDGSTLRQGTGGSGEGLDLKSFAVINLRSHLELGAVWQQTTWLKSARLSLNVTNVLNQRQKIVDRTGNTPLQFQPAYRDPLGRTFQIELRRKFQTSSWGSR